MIKIKAIKVLVMLRIDFLFVGICSKPISFSTTTIIQTRTLSLQSSPLVTQTSLHYYRWHLNPPEVENPCPIVNNRYTSEVLRARKKFEEMPENSGHKNSSNGLHPFCAFIIHNRIKTPYS